MANRSSRTEIGSLVSAGLRFDGMFSEDGSPVWGEDGRGRRRPSSAFASSARRDERREHRQRRAVQGRGPWDISPEPRWGEILAATSERRPSSGAASRRHTRQLELAVQPGTRRKPFGEGRRPQTLAVSRILRGFGVWTVRRQSGSGFISALSFTPAASRTNGYK